MYLQSLGTPCLLFQRKSSRVFAQTETAKLNSRNELEHFNTELDLTGSFVFISLCFLIDVRARTDRHCFLLLLFEFFFVLIVFFRGLYDLLNIFYATTLVNDVCT